MVDAAAALKTGKTHRPDFLPLGGQGRPCSMLKTEY